MPMKAKSLQKHFINYTPSTNKLLWYSQFPRPVKLPNLEYFKSEKHTITKKHDEKSLFQSNS